MMERQFKGIWIPAEIWEDTALTWNEKIVLMEIDSFTAAGKDCYISDEYIGNLVGVSARTASTIVSKLIRLGYVKKTRSDGRHRYLETAIFAEQTRKICGADTQNLQTTYTKNTYIKLQEKEEIHKEERFRKPSLSEVREYCESRHNGIDAEAFIAFYESKGWMVGKNRMSNWKAAVITWEKSLKTAPTPNPSPKHGKNEESIVDYYRRILGEINAPENGTDAETPDEQ